MGIIDKIKGIFSKKDKKQKAPKEKCDCGCEGKKASSKSYASEFNGADDVSKSLKFAAEKIDFKVGAGMPVAVADSFLARLKEVESSDADAESKKVQISQLIGGIIRA